jgi:AcrR family transcriptional regulator
LLVNIAEDHVTRLRAIVEEAMAEEGTPEGRMRALVRRLVEEYASAQNEHRVLTEDVKFLQPEDRERILGKEREVVAAFAQVVSALRPDLKEAAMSKPLTMLLFGMVNWMFTWMKPEGRLAYEDMAPVVADLFLGGLEKVQAPVRIAALD